MILNKFINVRRLVYNLSFDKITSFILKDKYCFLLIFSHKNQCNSAGDSSTFAIDLLVEFWGRFASPVSRFSLICVNDGTHYPIKFLPELCKEGNRTDMYYWRILLEISKWVNLLLQEDWRKKLLGIRRDRQNKSF